MTQANMLEMMMVDLINQERAAAGAAALTIDNDLNTSSELHSGWMLENDIFSHTGVDGSSSNDRIVAAGYELEGAWATGENIGWQSERGAAGLEDDVRAIHESLMNSPGHRANILNANFTEIGIGIEQGDFDAASGTFDAVMVTQNFGTTEAVDDDVPADDGAISETPEVMLSDAMLDDVPADDDVATDDPGDDVPADDDVATDDLGDDMPADDDVATDDPGDDMPADDAGDDSDDVVISRDYVQTSGRITNTVTETVTVNADGTTTRIREETQTETTDDAPFDFGSLDDVFDFAGFGLDDGDDGVTVSDFAFSFSGPDGTVNTDDPAEFEDLLADFFDDIPPPTPCVDAMFA